MRVLIGCEFSQIVTIAFRKRGHEAYSCDIIPCEGGHPEWHIQEDVLKVINQKWDLGIFHPPCTYLSNAGARFLYPKGKLNIKRLANAHKAKEFFMQLWTVDIGLICIENPTPSKIIGLPEHTQTIQPYYFGDMAQKRTLLWLKRLPALEYSYSGSLPESTKVAGNWYNKGGKDRQKKRSRTFQGIANAMAEQWG